MGFTLDRRFGRTSPQGSLTGSANGEGILNISQLECLFEGIENCRSACRVRVSLQKLKGMATRTNKSSCLSQPAFN